MTEQHLNALLNVLDQLPENDDKPFIRDIAIITKQALTLADSIAFEQRLFAQPAPTAQEIVAALDEEAETALETASFASDYDSELTVDEKVACLEILVNAGVSTMTKVTDLPGLDEVLAFFDTLLDQFAAESVAPDEFTGEELDAVADVFDAARRELIAMGYTAETIAPIDALEDRVFSVIV